MTGADTVVVGGFCGIQVHDLTTHTSRRIRVTGEPKAGFVEGDTAYLALYPSGSVAAINLTSGTQRQVATVGEEQVRPRALVRSGSTLLLGTRPDYGQLGGALSIIDEADGSVVVYRDVIADQSISAIACAEEIAYLGSETTGDGIEPKATDALVAYFDLRSRTVTRTIVPVPGATRIYDLLVHGPALLGVANTGVLFALDRSSGEVTSTKQVGGRGGSIQIVRGDVLFVDGDQVVRIRLADWHASVLVAGLGSLSQAETPARLGANGEDIYAIAKTDLIRIRTNPAPKRPIPTSPA
jgi:hypothetical protein